MKEILVYDPPMCCASGVCGPDVDPLLPRFAGMLAQLASNGVRVERFNLAQEPAAFARNPSVRTLIEKEGIEVLPLVFVDGVMALKGHYPDADERASIIERSKMELSANGIPDEEDS